MPDDTDDEKRARAEDEQALETMMEALAKVSGKLEGLHGKELQQHVADVRSQVRSLVATTQKQEQDFAARQLAADELDRLLDTMVATGTAAGKAIEQRRGAIARTFNGVDVAKIADGLRLLSRWLRDPNAGDQGAVEKLIGELEAEMGPGSGLDAEAEAARQRAEIEQTVQSSLDRIFSKKKPSAQ